MRYLIDKNLLTHEIMKNETRRYDLCIIEDVIDEAGMNADQIKSINQRGIQCLKVSKHHLEKLKIIMTSYGSNLKLINLCHGKGSADVVMLAYILSEQEIAGTLFINDFTILTKDKELINVATQLGIKTIGLLGLEN